jgi:septal ring factor EnvC (AmiA/AmiB activator)
MHKLHSLSKRQQHRKLILRDRILRMRGRARKSFSTDFAVLQHRLRCAVSDAKKAGAKIAAMEARLADVESRLQDQENARSRLWAQVVCNANVATDEVFDAERRVKKVMFAGLAGTRESIERLRDMVEGIEERMPDHYRG